MPKYKMRTIALVPVEAIIEIENPSDRTQWDRAQQLARLVAIARFPTAEGATQAGIEQAPDDANLDVSTCDHCKKASPKISWGPGWMKCPGCGSRPFSAMEWRMAFDVDCSCPATQTQPASGRPEFLHAMKVAGPHEADCSWVKAFKERNPVKAEVRAMVFGSTIADEELARHMETSFNTRPGDERLCKLCEKPWRAGAWNFYDLCDTCFREFNAQKMNGRSPPPPGVRYELGVNYFESSTDWIAMKKRNASCRCVCHGPSECNGVPIAFPHEPEECECLSAPARAPSGEINGHLEPV